MFTPIRGQICYLYQVIFSPFSLACCSNSSLLLKNLRSPFCQVNLSLRSGEMYAFFGFCFLVCCCSVMVYSSLAPYDFSLGVFFLIILLQFLFSIKEFKVIRSHIEFVELLLRRLIIRSCITFCLVSICLIFVVPK